MKKYNHKTQKSISRSNNGKIKSIMPIYKESEDIYNRIIKQSIEVAEMAKKYPRTKIQVEVNSIPENIYNMLKEDLNYGPNFQDGAGRFFYSPTVNSAIIIHKEF